MRLNQLFDIRRRICFLNALPLLVLDPLTDAVSLLRRSCLLDPKVETRCEALLLDRHMGILLNNFGKPAILPPEIITIRTQTTDDSILPTQSSPRVPAIEMYPLDLALVVLAVSTSVVHPKPLLNRLPPKLSPLKSLNSNNLRRLPLYLRLANYPVLLWRGKPRCHPPPVPPIVFLRARHRHRP